MKLRVSNLRFTRAPRTFTYFFSITMAIALFTPMNFVIDVLINFFGMPEEKATTVMLQIHTQGVGVCGTYSKDVAETKVYIVNTYSLEHQHPLKCTMEEL
jgi:ATP-dependent Clp protease adaptor protein ClpS